MKTKERSSLAALAATALLLAAGIGSAQQAHAPEGVSAEQGAPEGERDEIVMQPEHRRASGLLGTPVFDVEGTQIGEIDDLILSDDGMIAVVLAVGGIAGIGEKLVLVHWDQLDTAFGAEEEEAEGRPDGGIGLREVTGRQLADSLPRFRYEPK